MNLVKYGSSPPKQFDVHLLQCKTGLEVNKLLSSLSDIFGIAELQTNGIHVQRSSFLNSYFGTFAQIMVFVKEALRILFVIAWHHTFS